MKYTILAIISFYGAVHAVLYSGDRLNICDRSFHVIERLGAGSNGQVFQVEDTTTKEIVAIKAVDTRTEGGKLDFIREVTIMRRMGKHENIVEFICDSKGPTNSFLVMEYCNGGDLQTLVNRISDDQFLQLWKDVANGLLAMRYKQVAHRDLKPGNIFIHDGRLKIGDFGLATVLENGRMTTSVCGTLYYLAPEIIKQAPYDTRVDLWSAGITMYTVLIGEHPFMYIGGTMAQNPQQFVEKLRLFIQHTDTIMASVQSENIRIALKAVLHELPSDRRLLTPTWL